MEKVQLEWTSQGWDIWALLGQGESGSSWYTRVFACSSVNVQEVSPSA